MEVNPVSLANLQPGRVTTKAEREAGKNLIVAAIVDALRNTVQDDDTVRKHLCKVSDFEVTEAARQKVLEDKARRVYQTIFGKIRDKVIGREVVSINGFATFTVESPPEGVEVGVALQGNKHAILKTDVRVSDYMTAEVVAGSWLGELIPDSFMVPVVLPDWKTMQFLARRATPAEWAVRAALLVTATGSDGAIRKYLIYCFAEVVRGFIEVRDGYDWMVVDSASRDAVMAKWSEVASRGVDWLGAKNISEQRLMGVVPSVALQTYPRKVKVIRDLSIWQDTYYIRRIPMELFRDYFGYREWELRASGDWPDRKKNLEDRVKVEFRDEFIEAMHKASV